MRWRPVGAAPLGAGLLGMVAYRWAPAAGFAANGSAAKPGPSRAGEPAATASSAGVPGRPDVPAAGRSAG